MAIGIAPGAVLITCNPKERTPETDSTGNDVKTAIVMARREIDIKKARLLIRSIKTS